MRSEADTGKQEQQFPKRNCCNIINYLSFSSVHAYCFTYRISSRSEDE